MTKAMKEKNKVMTKRSTFKMTQPYFKILSMPKWEVTRTRPIRATKW